MTDSIADEDPGVIDDEGPDFIDRLRAKQVAAAGLLGAPRLQALEGQFSHWLGEAARKANLDPDSLDHEAAREFLRDQHERDVFVALMGYSTWLATQLYRRYLAAGTACLDDEEDIPECGSGDVAQIATAFSVDRETLEWTINGIQSWPGGFELPGVGRFAGSQILINAVELTNWAAHYDWSSES